MIGLIGGKVYWSDDTVSEIEHITPSIGDSIMFTVKDGGRLFYWSTLSYGGSTKQSPSCVMYAADADEGIYSVFGKKIKKIDLSIAEVAE